MTKQTRSSGIIELLRLFGSAVAVAGATEGGRRAKAGDLRRLGIEPAQWERIGR